MTDDICGYPTAEDTPCQHPTTDDGDSDRCWVDAHNESDTDTDDPGRKSKFSYKRAHFAIESARDGKSKAGCARAAGVDKSTLNDWLNAGCMFGPLDFRHAFMRARAEGESELIEGGLYDDDVNPSMAKFLLASSFKYQTSQEIEHSGEVDVDVEADFSDTST